MRHFCGVGKLGFGLGREPELTTGTFIFFL